VLLGLPGKVTNPSDWYAYRVSCLSPTPTGRGDWAATVRGLRAGRGGVRSGVLAKRRSIVRASL